MEREPIGIFVTGATGWVGSAVVAELIGAGHPVTGLARSADKAAVLAATGAEVVLGTLDDLDLLRGAASAAEAVIHTAFNHDFSRFAENARQDQRAIEVLGAALERADRPLIVTSGVALLAPGRVAVEAGLQHPHAVAAGLDPDRPGPAERYRPAGVLCGVRGGPTSCAWQAGKLFS